MKRIITVISALTASMLFSAIVTLGVEKNPVPFGTYGNLQSSHIKNECLLVAKNCVTESSTVQQRVDALRNEIAKGYKVYTPTELNMLKEQLKWIVSENNEFI
jgi:hypothetical protein